MENYLENNIEIIKNPTGTPLSAPMKKVKGLAPVIKAIYKQALAHPSHQYIDETLFTYQGNTDDLFKSMPKSFKNKFSVKHVQRAIRLLSLAGLLIPCDWQMLNNKTRGYKYEIVKQHRQNFANYQFIQNVFALPNLATAKLHCERLNVKKMTLGVDIMYVVIAAKWGYPVAEATTKNLNFQTVMAPKVNQIERLVVATEKRKMFTLEGVKPFLVMHGLPAGKKQPMSDSHFRKILTGLDAVGYLSDHNLAYDSSSKIANYLALPDRVKPNEKVLYSQSVIL